MTEINDRVMPPVSPEEKGINSPLQREGWANHSGIDQSTQSTASGDKPWRASWGDENAFTRNQNVPDAIQSGFPALNIGDSLATGRNDLGYGGLLREEDARREEHREERHEEELARERSGPLGLGILPAIEHAVRDMQLATGHHHHGGGFYPYGGPGGFSPFEPPTSSGEFQTNSGVANFERTGHHHSGYYEGSGGFKAPVPSGEFQTNGGVANFETTGHHHSGYYEGSGGFKAPASSGEFQTNTGVANFERTGHHHGALYANGGYYPYPLPYERVTPSTGIGASGGYDTQVRKSQTI